jgi:hypothetical protein
VSIPTLSDLIRDWVVQKKFNVHLSDPDEFDESIYIDANDRWNGWIADILNTACKVNLRDSHQSISGSLRPEDPDFFDALEAHINARIKEGG